MQFGRRWTILHAAYHRLTQWGTLLVRKFILRGIIRSPGIRYSLSIGLRGDGKVGCMFGAGATTAWTKRRMGDWSCPTISSRASKPIANWCWMIRIILKIYKTILWINAAICQIYSPGVLYRVKLGEENLAVTTATACTSTTFSPGSSLVEVNQASINLVTELRSDFLYRKEKKWVPRRYQKCEHGPFKYAKTWFWIQARSNKFLCKVWEMIYAWIIYFKSIVAA